jgi:ferredoxin
MPHITTNTGLTFEAPANQRLILALEDAGVDILHRCGGNSRCTTCRVTFEAGEPDKMTVAEKTKLEAGGNMGKFRLSCQILCDQDMTVTPLMSKATEQLDDAGPRPLDTITPDAEWVTKA